MFESFQVTAPAKTLSRRGQADRVVKEDNYDDSDDEEPNQEELSSSGEKKVRGREMRKDKQKESWDSKESKELKERKEIKTVEAIQRQEDSLEKVKYLLLWTEHHIRGHGHIFKYAYIF